MKQLFEAVERATNFVVATNTVRVPVTAARKRVLMKDIRDLRVSLEALETALDIVVPICGRGK